MGPGYVPILPSHCDTNKSGMQTSSQAVHLSEDPEGKYTLVRESTSSIHDAWQQIMDATGAGQEHYITGMKMVKKPSGEICRLCGYIIICCALQSRP